MIRQPLHSSPFQPKRENARKNQLTPTMMASRRNDAVTSSDHVASAKPKVRVQLTGVSETMLATLKGRGSGNEQESMNSLIRETQGVFESSHMIVA